MVFFIYKPCGFCKDFIETSLLQIWLSWDECILFGTHKIMLMIHLSHICQSSNLFAYQFLNKLTCAILMNLQDVVLLFGILICDTCCLYQSITTIFFPFLIFVMSLTCLGLKFINTIRLNWTFGHALKQKKILLVFAWLHFDIMFFCLISILCVHVYLW
jgi:hypothetical protein